MSETAEPVKKKFPFFKWLFFLLCLGAIAGLGFGVLVLRIGESFDDLKMLEQHKPILYSKIYDRNGNIIDIISSEQRIVLDFEDIPKDFVHALVAVEDEHFFEHIGVSPMGIMSAIKDNFLKKRMRGASTLTQQLVKNITKDKRLSYKRKLKEQFLAVQLEAMFTKEEIFAMYVNEVPFGNNQFGIESAARYYFGKSVGALTLEECATLAGIPQAPSRLNPYRDIDACTVKRNIVLERMMVENYITPAELAKAKKTPLVVRDRKRNTSTPVAGYWVDKIRKYVFDKYGEDAVRTSGWDIHTTLDIKYQNIAENAVKEGLKGVDKALGYRHFDTPSVFSKEGPKDPNLLKDYFDPSWHKRLQEGISIRGLVLKVETESIDVKVQEHIFTLNQKNMSWVTKIKDMNRHFKVGDVPLFMVELKDPSAEQTINLEEYHNEETGDAEAYRLAMSEDDSDETTEVTETELETAHLVKDNFPFTLALDQEPNIEGAFMAVDNYTGDILAMVGGYDYRRSKFNRAEQAKRQVGSAFKPIIFGAAFEQGYTLADTLFDEPTLFVDPTQFYFDEEGELQVRTRNASIARKMKLGLIPKPKPYQPHNYYNKYVGNVTLRNALAQSKNIVSVKLLNSVGYDNVMSYVHDLKLYDDSLQPFPSLALGAFELTLHDMVYTYATFANSGVRYEPRSVSMIMDSKGRVIEENPPRGEQLISPQNAYMVTEAMKSVIFDPKGSGGRARQLNYPHLAGKTGTTNDYADAWFLGYSPNITAGTWVGRDVKHSIGRNRAGSNTALPIWKKFYEGIRDQLPEKPFPLPEGLVKIPVDRATGKKMTLDCDCDDSKIILETFAKGNEPTDICTSAEQARAQKPWFLQKRTYIYDAEESQVKPNLVIIDNPSQLRALRLMKTYNKELENNTN